MARMNNKDGSLYREILQEIEDAKTGPAPPNYPACLIYSTQRSSEAISGSKSTLEDLPLVNGDDIKRLLTSFWEKLQAEDISEQKAKAKMEDMFKELICVSANEVLGALVNRKSLYNCSPGKVQVSQTGVKGSLSPIFRTFIKTTSTEEFIALDGVIKLLCTEVTHTVNSVLKDNCGFERILLVEEKDYSTPRRTLRHIAANAPMFLPHMTFSDQWETLIEAEISKNLTENELKSGVLDSENKATEESASEQERVMSEFSERSPSPGRLHVSAEPQCEEQMEVKQEKCDILSHGEILLPGAPHDETETQFNTEQTSSCELAQNQEPAPQSSLNQEPAPKSSLNQEPAPQSSLNQEPAPQSSLIKPGPKKQKPAKDLQGGLEEPKTPIESFSTSEREKSPPITIRYNLPSDERERSPPITIRYSLPSDERERSPPITIRYSLPSDERERSPPTTIRYSLPSDERERSPPTTIRYSLPSDERERSPPTTIRYSLPSDERERSPPITIRYSLPSDERERSPPTTIRYSLPSDAPFFPLHLIPEQGLIRIMKNHEFSSQWDTGSINILAWEVSRHILQDKHLSMEHPLVKKLYQRLEEEMWEWNVKESPKHIKKIACDIYRDLCSKREKKWIHFSALVSEEESDNIITEIHKHLVRPKKRGKLCSFFHSIRHALCRYC